MDTNYFKAKARLEALKETLEGILKDSPSNSFEDEIAHRKLENLIEKLESNIDDLEHFSKPTVEGVLMEMDNGKFELLDSKGKCVTYFSCGSPIECYVEFDDGLQWVAGRVEHTTKDGYSGYYFYGGEKPFLYNGMRARIRKSTE